jgi:hypothetical protein
MLAEPFPSNGCFCWFHSFCFEQMCHNNIHSATSTNFINETEVSKDVSDADIVTAVSVSFTVFAVNRCTIILFIW